MSNEYKEWLKDQTFDSLAADNLRVKLDLLQEMSKNAQLVQTLQKLSKKSEWIAADICDHSPYNCKDTCTEEHCPVTIARKAVTNNAAQSSIISEEHIRKQTQNCIDILAIEDLHPDIEIIVNAIWAYLTDLAKTCGITLEEYSGE